MEIITKRLMIRPYKESDVSDAVEFLLNKEMMHYIPESFNSEQDVLDFITNKEHQEKFFPIVLLEEEKVIGHLSFEPFFGDHSYEIGWIFYEDYHQKGYAKEAAYALLDWGFKEKNIHRVIATCQPENIGSWKLMESLGMRREAFFKACIPFEDGWWDEYYYAVLNSEWEK